MELSKLPLRQILAFAAVGLVNTLVGYAVIFGCMYLARMTPVASNVAGYAIGLVVSYFLNRRFTFKSGAVTLQEVVRFVSIFLVAYLSNLAILTLCIDVFDLHDGLSQVIAGAVYTGLFFLLSKFYVFRSAKN